MTTDYTLWPRQRAAPRLHAGRARDWNLTTMGGSGEVPACCAALGAARMAWNPLRSAHACWLELQGSFSTQKDLTPKDHAEPVATFRRAFIGSVCARKLSHGDLVEALRVIASVRVRPPCAKLTETYSVPTAVASALPGRIAFLHEHQTFWTMGSARRLLAALDNATNAPRQAPQDLLKVDVRAPLKLAKRIIQGIAFRA